MLKKKKVWAQLDKSLGYWRTKTQGMRTWAEPEMPIRGITSEWDDDVSLGTEW